MHGLTQICKDYNLKISEKTMDCMALKGKQQVLHKRIYQNSLKWQHIQRMNEDRSVSLILEGLLWF